MSARTEAVEEGNMKAEYCMMEEEGGCLLKRKRAFDGSYVVVAELEVRFA